MPHGQRDWSNIGADETVHGVADMAELAARLGSPVTFNREGNILLLETFEHGIKNWAFQDYGTGAYHRWSAVKSRYGAYSALLVPGTDAQQLAQMQRQIPYPVYSKFGMEAGIHASGDPLYMEQAMYVYDGTIRHDYTIRYRFDTEILQRRVTGATWATIDTDVAWSEDPTLFHDVKIVADFNRIAYERLIFDNNEYDLSAYDAWTYASALAPAIWLWLRFVTTAGQTTTYYVDDVIVTQNEP